MKFHLVGCSHHGARVEVREQIAFNALQVRQALMQLRQRFPKAEAVVLSTCNRTEVYTASVDARNIPAHADVVDFIADFHGIKSRSLEKDLFRRSDEQVVQHLFRVASSLDSMVVGEAQILGQVKSAYKVAKIENSTGPLTHSVFQEAIRVARHVSSATSIHRKRVSIPSIAVAEFARNIFERLDDKRVLVIGAGDMGEETLRYLVDAGARDFVVVNRSSTRAESLAKDFDGTTARWEELDHELVKADLIVSTTGANRAVVTLDDFKRIESKRYQRDLFILDLAIPRDFDPHIGNRVGVYLYCIDDLQRACEVNRRERRSEWDRAQRIVEEETARFMADLNHRATGPTIKRLKETANQIKDDELSRLLNKLDSREALDAQSREEIHIAFDRLINKILHPPLESLRDEAQSGTPHGLIDALRRLFQLKD